MFVRTVKTISLDAAYDSAKFYEAWQTVIQRYGIYNPYTGRGAIKGLLPHGPHNLRDILATHILKQTGSYEQAYAIQDTPDVVRSTTAASYRKIRPRLRRKSSIRFGKLHSHSDEQLVHIAHDTAMVVSALKGSEPTEGM